MAALNQTAISAAATILWGHWTASTRLSELPDHCRPADRSDAYAIQAAVAALSGQRVVGWKIAATSLVGQDHIGVDGPLAGRLLSSRVATISKDRHAPTPTSLAGNAMRVGEAEFLFRMRASLPARERIYGIQEVLDAVDALHPAIEIPDSRYIDFARVGAPHLIADHACACWLIVGEAATASWQEHDLAAHVVETFLNGRPAERGLGANVLRDPRLALTWLANELRTYGRGLTTGDLVTTGTCITPVPVAPGDVFRADFGTFGAVEVKLG